MAEPKNNKNYWVEPLKMFFRLSAWIVFPVLLGVLLGKWLDNRYNSSPKWFLIVVGLSFVISMVGLVKDTLKEYKNIEKRK
jgi:F0F1-type ATP synthase assembly protein I